MCLLLDLTLSINYVAGSAKTSWWGICAPRKESLIDFLCFVFTAQVSKLAKKIRKRWNSRKTLYIDVVLDWTQRGKTGTIVCFRLKIVQLSWLWVQSGVYFEFISSFTNLHWGDGSGQMAPSLSLFLHKGCRSVCLLQCSQKTLFHCCCVLTTNWLMETVRLEGREREEDSIRSILKDSRLLWHSFRFYEDHITNTHTHIDPCKYSVCLKSMFIFMARTNLWHNFLFVACCFSC